MDASPARFARKIVHVDVDAFFASVEQVLNPSLRGKPVLVGRGVVASASYEAKRRGVTTAMTIRQALQICPDAVLVAGQYENYAAFGRRLRDLLEGFSPAVEAASLDDFYVDFTGTDRLYPNFEATLRGLQADVEKRLGLTVSLGAASNKMIASIASRIERPRGFAMVPACQEAEFLAPLPIEKLPGIGRTHARTLQERGIRRVEDLRLLPLEILESAFGQAIGRQIYERARGIDPRKVVHRHIPRSVSRETTVEHGTTDLLFLGALLEYLAERIGATLRAQNLQAASLALKLRYTDGIPSARAARLDPATNDPKHMAPAASRLLAELYTRRVAVGFVGIAASSLRQESMQNLLFDRKANHRWYLNRSIDRVRGKYGWNKVYFGRGLELRRHYREYANGVVLSTPCLSR